MTKPTFRNLNPKNKEWAKRQVENYNKKLPGITKKYEEFKKTGKLPENMHVDDIFQKEHGISNNEYFRGYDTKKLRKKEVDYDYYREILDDAENDFVQGDETLETLEGMVKEQQDYHAYMYDQYKTGKLEPKAGEVNRGRLELLRERADSAYGDPKMFTRDEMDELDVLEDYFKQVDKEEAFRSAEAKEIARGKASGSPWFKDPKILSPEAELRKEFPGIDDNMIRNILTDKNPQRIAEVKQTMREALEMQQKGMSPEGIIKTLKDTSRKKNADGGRASLMYGGDPGFAFEYGGSWADWRDRHQHQMPVTDYIKTKLPKERLPFRDMQSGGLAYMLGEPTYMKYGIGGSVGHAPWHKPTAQQQPQQQLDTPAPQVGGAQSPGRGQPNPMKGPQGLPSLAPRTMDPQYMQQQMMQKAMMGQGQGMGQPRMGMDVGGMTQDDFDRYLRERKQRDEGDFKGDFLDDFERWQKYQKERTVPVAKGGRIGFGLGGIDKGRRAFMKWLAGILGTGVAAGTGLLKLGKLAPKVVPKVTETVVRGADGMPTYIDNLIEVVKAKGTKDIIEGFKKSDYSTVHSYKGVDVIEDGAGNIKIKNDRSGMATDSTTGKLHEGIAEERHMQIEKGQMNVKDEGLETQKSFQEPDEYIEGSVRPDMDGKMKDFEEGLDEDAHEFFKKIADEVDTLVIKKTKKASGGLAYMLGE